MKINTSTPFLKTNIDLDKKDSQILNVSKIFRILTKDLYKYPLQTAIQEYINNAKDAHVIVGKDTSTIEITAPTLANQNVIIKDYGSGLSETEIQNVFINLTESTKDNSDKFIGGYGIGSKSWFSVNSFFYVISRYKGIKSHYEISFLDTISSQKILTEVSDEPDGLEIILPLANSNQIDLSIKSIHRAIYFWKTRPNLINTELNEITYIYKSNDFKILNKKEPNSDIQLFITLEETQYLIHNSLELAKRFPFIKDFDIELSFSLGESGIPQEVGPDREFFHSDMYPLILKKLELIKEQLLQILLDYIESCKDIDTIISIVILNSFNKKDYVINYYGIPLICIKNFIDKEFYFQDIKSTLSSHWNNKLKLHKSIFSDKDTLVVINFDSLNKKKSILKNHLESLNIYNFSIIHESKLNEDNIKSYEKIFNMIYTKDLNIKFPLTEKELLSQENPLIRINQTYDVNNTEQTLNKEQSKESFILLNEINPEWLIIPCGLYNTLPFDYFKILNKSFYVVNKATASALNQFNLKIQDKDSLELIYQDSLNLLKNKKIIEFNESILEPSLIEAVKYRPLIMHLLNNKPSWYYDNIQLIFENYPEFKISFDDLIKYEKMLLNFHSNYQFLDEYPNFIHKHSNPFYDKFFTQIELKSPVLFLFLEKKIINSFIPELSLLAKEFINNIK